MKRILSVVSFLAAACLVMPAFAADTIKVGMPMVLSGGGALFGKPTAQGGELYVKQINDAGGVLGKKIELIVRDCGNSQEEAVRTAQEMILKQNIQFMVGGFTATQGLALSELAKQEKILYIAPISKAKELTDAAHLHPYVFRGYCSTEVEGKTGAQAAKKWAKTPIKRVATISPDYAYGQETTAAFIDQIKKELPGVEIVHQGWPKLGESDYAPYITALVASKPDTIFTALWGGHFVTFGKQAAPFGVFKNSLIIAAGEGGSPETGRSLMDELPDGMISDSYDQHYYPDTPEHKAYFKALEDFTGEKNGSSFASGGYIAMQFLVEAIKKAGTTDTDKVIKALEGIEINSPIGKLSMRAKDHQSTRGPFWGVVSRDKNIAPYPIMIPIEFFSSSSVLD